MLDLETFGTQPGCIVRSIGAVLFDPFTGEMGKSLYFNLRVDRQKAKGLVVNPDTVAWWEKQSEAAKKAFEGDRVDVEEAHEALRKLKPAKASVWAQGASFDGPIWDAVVSAFELAPAWRFYDLRDTRTVYDIADFDTRSVNRKGTFHNALDDCKHQVRCVAAALRKMELEAGV